MQSKAHKANHFQCEELQLKQRCDVSVVEASHPNPYTYKLASIGFISFVTLIHEISPIPFTVETES